MLGVWLLLVWLICPVSFGSSIVSGQVPKRFTDYIKKTGQHSFQKKSVGSVGLFRKLENV